MKAILTTFDEKTYSCKDKMIEIKEEKKERNFKLFPVGTKVRINTNFEDFHFFNKTESGIVVRNNNEYLGIIVAFDKPRIFEDDTIQYKFGFNPENLVLLEKSNKKLKLLANEIRLKVEPNGCDHCWDKSYCRECHKDFRSTIIVGDLNRLKDNYQKLLNFTKRVKSQSCCNVCNCLACDALTVLREIGE